MPSSKEYMKSYYQQNRERLLEERRRRYESDPNYREKVLSRATVRASLRSMASKARVKTVEHNKKREQAFHLIEMEGRVNRDKDVLYSWRRSGELVLPNASYHDGRGRGLYSESQVKYVGALLAMIDSGKLTTTYKNLGRILALVWKETYHPGKLSRAIAEVFHGKKFYAEDRDERKARIAKAGFHGGKRAII